MPHRSLIASIACTQPINPHHRSENAGLGAAVDALLPVGRVQAAVAGRIRLAGIDDRHLTVEADRRAGDERYAGGDAGGVDGEAGREVVAAVEHHAAVGHEDGEILLVEAVLDRLDARTGIDREAGGAGGVGLGAPHPIGGVGDLTLQVRDLDGVEVGEGQAPDAGRGEVHRDRRTEPAEPDDQGVRLVEAALPGRADLRQREVARVAAVGGGVHGQRA